MESKEKMMESNQNLKDIGSYVAEKPATPEESAELLMKQIGLEKSLRVLRDYEAIIDNVPRGVFIGESEDYLTVFTRYLEGRLLSKRIATRMDPDKVEDDDWLLREMVRNWRVEVLGEGREFRKKPCKRAKAKRKK